MASDPEATTESFQCALCNKSFSRRDLRNRHKRRCEKTFGKIRPSKKKSCDACGKSKLRCDLPQILSSTKWTPGEIPACSRCTSRQMPCQYTTHSAATTTAHSNASSPDGLDASSVEGPGMHEALSAMLSHQSLHGSSPPNMTNPLVCDNLPMVSQNFDHLGLYDTSADDSMLDAHGLDLTSLSHHDMGSWDGSDMMKGLPDEASLPADVYMPLVDHGEALSAPTLISRSDPNFTMPLHDDLQLLDQDVVFQPSITLQNSSYTSNFNSDSNYASPMFGIEHIDSEPVSRPMSDSSLGFSSASASTRSGSLSTLSTVNSATSGALSSATSRSQSSLSNMKSSPEYQVSYPVHSRTRSANSNMVTKPKLDTRVSMNHSRRPSLTTASSSSFPLIGKAAVSGSVDSPSTHIGRPLSSARLNLQIPNVEEAAMVLCNYPQQLLDPSFRSPFIHHTMYRESTPELPEPLAVALCCISAKAQAVKSSDAFVSKMINEQRERLINDFPRKKPDLVDTTSTLHALCIYQIESMLAPRKQQALSNSISEAEFHHSFLLKITKLAYANRQEDLQQIESSTTEWNEWILTETLRRTIFLVNMINDFSFASKALNAAYYEQLDPNHILDMPLPATEDMWKASSPAEWTAAKHSNHWNRNTPRTVRKAVEMVHRGEDLGDLEMLQRLVIGCALLRLD